jgi:hypothetical protein
MRAWKQFVGLKILKNFDTDPDLGSKIFLTLDPGRDPGWKNFESGIIIPDPGTYFLNGSY